MEAITHSPRLFTSKQGCITLPRSFTTELSSCCFYSNSLITSIASGVWENTGGNLLANGAILSDLGVYHRVFGVWLLYRCVDLPLHPSVLSFSELESGAERAHHIQQIVATLPRTVIIVMRYLFAFLNQ